MKGCALRVLVGLVCACNAPPSTNAAPMDSGSSDFASDTPPPDIAGAPRDLISAAPPDLSRSPPHVEIHFTPAVSGLQIAVWIEDQGGSVVATLYVTSDTAMYGLGNRPGAALLVTDVGWPYGRREMVLPVWAHRRNHAYPKVLMGGECIGQRVAGVADACGGGMACGVACDESTIAYHDQVASAEPHYCQGMCPWGRYTSKGVFAAAPLASLYPPRADLRMFAAAAAIDAMQFAATNDVVAVSAATPLASKDPGPIVWESAQAPAGDYVAWIEVSHEADFNASNRHPNQVDSIMAWTFEGHEFLGQPSVLYRVPFHLGTSDRYAAKGYAGYGAWDGADGELRPPDGTISDSPGTGAGRLLDLNGARVTVNAYE